MASKIEMWHFVVVFLMVCSYVNAKEKSVPIALNEDTWRDLLEGEWLVKFYAPWCPACKSLAPTWEKVATWSDDLSIKVAHIDVTENPGLSGRFLVTALPTIYHVKDGEFRVYRGSRDETDFVSFIDDKKWQPIDPVAWYFSPTSMHMSAVAMFFKLSIAIRDLHNTMTAEFGIPVWGSYTIFALATILLGLVLGLIVVCLCDVMWPPKHSVSPNSARQRRLQQEKDDDNESDVIEDDRYDALDTSKTADVRPKSARRRAPRRD